MRLGISAASIRRPVLALLLMIVLLGLGIFSYLRLPINAEPQVNLPLLVITINQAGAAPEEIESAITIPVEQACASVAELRHIFSTITEGSSVTTLEFSLDADLNKALNAVKNALNGIKASLPKSSEEPLIEINDTDGGALAYYAVESSELNETELSWFIDDKVVTELLALEGVQKVKRLGGKEKEVRVELDVHRLNQYKISVDEINSQIKALTQNVPAGRTQLGDMDYALKVLSRADNVQELEELPITLSSNRVVKLAELGTVSLSSSLNRGCSFLNGRRIVGFNVYRARGASDTEVFDRVNSAIAKINSSVDNLVISNVYNSVSLTEENFSTALKTFIEGTLLTVLVVFLFLGNLRSTLLAAISIPLALLPTFMVMELLDYTLNSISLLALTLVIGILVDDAIVEIENIERHLSLPKRPYQAALDASEAIGFTVLLISLCLIAVFLPVSFVTGITGQYFRQFGVTVAVAVTGSLLVARVITPVLCAYLLKPQRNAGSNSFFLLQNFYLRYLILALRHKKLTGGLAALFTLISLVTLATLPTAFTPVADNGISQLVLTLPPNSTAQSTQDSLKSIEQRIRAFACVERTFINIDNAEVSKGELLVVLKPHAQRQISTREFQQQLAEILQLYPDLRFTFNNDMSQRDVVVMLTGRDLSLLEKTALALQEEMRRIRGLDNVQIKAPLLKQELRFELLPYEAASKGIQVQNVGDLIRIATQGDVESNLGRMNTPEKQLPIRVLLKSADRFSTDALGHLLLSSIDGEKIQLNTIAHITAAQAAASIERFDRARKISVEADLLSGHTIGEILSEISSLKSVKQLPDGVDFPAYGDGEYIQEMFAQFGFACFCGLLLVYVILAVLFNDLFEPFSIMSALPLALGGAVLGLILYGGALDLSSVIGILMLMGIAAKNSILLVACINEKRSQGITRSLAICSAALERARPIMMTTFAMLAGMLPALFYSGAGATFRQSMAVTVIGGLITTTLLSLIMVPVLYCFFDELRKAGLKAFFAVSSVTKEDLSCSNDQAHQI